jgi:hypothetical protein
MDEMDITPGLLPGRIQTDEHPQADLLINILFNIIK